MLCSIIQPKCNHDTDCNTELLKCDQASSNVWWSEFSQVERHDHGQLTDSQTSDESADEDHRNVASSGLDDGSDEEDNVCEKEIPSSRNPVSDRTVDKSSEHGTKCQNSHHPSL